MKVIFLDNDGVICLANNWGGRLKKRKMWHLDHAPTEDDKMPVQFRFDDFDKKAIKVLNKILKKTKAEIVVSSDWRYHATVEELGDYYESQGIIKRPIGVTEDLRHEVIGDRHLRGDDLEPIRAIEIKKWLSEHPEVTHWVAIDDLRMGDDLDNFVETPKSREGIKQSGIKEKVLEFLID